MTLACRSLVTVFAVAISVGSLAACSSSSNNTSPDAGGHDSSVADASKDSSPNETSTGGSPLTGLSTEKWTWVPFPESRCRDGSSTGIGVNYNPTSDKVMIFLEGGGACFNLGTCVENANPYEFSETDFQMRATSSKDGFGLNVGIMDRTQAANPVKDWSYIYVPYCTGDVHAGNNPASVVKSVGTEDFAGYTNMQQYLSRVVPTFPKATQVLFTGMSAGGFGAAADYELAARAFGKVPVFMLDDSGPLMEDPYFPTCLATLTESLWGLDKTVFSDCGSACSTPSNAFIAYSKQITSKYPNVTFGFADSMDDGTISEFFGFGADNCTGYQQLSATQYGDGLLDIRAKLASATNFGTFYFPGTDHTTTQNANFYTRTSGTGSPDGGATDAGGGTLMVDWVTALLAGNATTVGP
jgi:Pectinacetylesterase